MPTDEIRRKHDEIKARKEKLLKDVENKSADVIQDIAEIVLIGYNAFSGGWIKFLAAVGIAIVKKIK